jgi:hypothetical protein
VAVNAGHACLLVRIRPQLIVFHAIGTDKVVAGYVRSAVLPVVVLFKKTVKVRTNVIAIVTGKALTISGPGKKTVILRLALDIGQVTGGAARAMAHQGIGIARGVKMAAQTAAAQQVVNQGQGSVWRYFPGPGNSGERIQRISGAKVLTHHVNHAGKPQMG